MLHKTHGIVLNFIRYRETSIVTRIYTEAFGMQSYIVNGVRGGQKKSKNKISFFQPLTLLELVVYYKKRAGLNRISEIKCAEPYTSLPYDFKKSTIALFIAEVLSKTLKEEEGNTSLFNFLHSSLLMLDHMPEGFHNFHLQFMLKLCRYLGFDLQSADELFDQVYEFIGKPEVAEEEKKIVNHLLSSSYTDMIKSKNEVRRILLNDIIKFYKLHIEGFGELKSVSILREIVG